MCNPLNYFLSNALNVTIRYESIMYSISINYAQRLETQYGLYAVPASCNDTVTVPDITRSHNLVPYEAS